MRMRKVRNPPPEYWAPESTSRRDDRKVVYDNDFLWGWVWALVFLGVFLIMFHHRWHIPLSLALTYTVASVAFLGWWTWLWRDSGVWIARAGLRVIVMRRVRVCLTWDEIAAFQYFARARVLAGVMLITTNGRQLTLTPTVGLSATYGKREIQCDVDALNAARAFFLSGTDPGGCRDSYPPGAADLQNSHGM
jgi:hypothetical protein